MAVSGFLLIDSGIQGYETAYAEQLALVEKKKKDQVAYDYLIFVEHPDVYTFGRKNKQPIPQDLKNTFAVERGGEVTFHNPGQLVAYPILKLTEKEQDVHLHLRRLESVLIDLLDEYGIFAERREGSTGVWLEGQEKKIASIGIAISNWITYHGCALNVENDLSGFSKINPCGFPSSVMTSMKTELKEDCPTMDEVKESFLRYFTQHFERYLMV